MAAMTFTTLLCVRVCVGVCRSVCMCACVWRPIDEIKQFLGLLENYYKRIIKRGAKVESKLGRCLCGLRIINAPTPSLTPPAHYATACQPNDLYARPDCRCPCRAIYLYEPARSLLLLLLAGIGPGPEPGPGPPLAFCHWHFGHIHKHT